ncbi:hypothetical protein [Crossiella sp. CA198]|uniref:hypothetical protein n=1 Tax=Crossiella sp. CA198 TaxID=3455607 RepID=UPI003F8D22FD
MRTIAIIAAAVSLMGSMVGMAGTGNAEPAAPLLQFSCAGVSDDLWHLCQNSRQDVPAANHLRIAVRGSQGRLVKFRAHRATDNSLIGSESACIKVGEPSSIIVRPRARAERVYIRARLCEGGEEDVHATTHF